jgi:hypothetical protein
MKRPGSVLGVLGLMATTAAAGCEGTLDGGPPPGEEVVTSTAALIAPGTVLIDAHFDSGADGFTYQDDTFRGTTQPAYATGTRIASGGFTGGALRVRLGGVDESDVTGMSGGWRRTFTLSESAQVTLDFRYNLIQTPNYEANEFSEIHATLDGTPLGFSPGSDHFVSISGDGEGGAPREVGWHPHTMSLGVLGAGTHTLVFGGFNNQKTSANESTDALIDDVRVVAGPPPGPQTILSATFDSNAQGFTYQDDLFRGTDEPAYATGAFSASSGFQGGGLTVTLGGRDEAEVLDGMSGGWSRTFTLPAAARVRLTFRYNLIQTPHYEADEFSQITASLDGVLFGELPGTDHFVSISGDGEGGPPRAVGWHHPSVDLGTLAAGDHLLSLGGFNNQKSEANESTTAFIDDVVVTATFSE